MFAAKSSAAAFVSLLVLAPAIAFADFSGSSVQARNQVATLSQQQLDGLNGRVFSDAFIAAKIVGYDRTEIDQLKADVAALKQDNAQLRVQLQSVPSPASTVPNSLDARVTRLEVAFDGLNSTLMLVVKMLTAVLAKL